MNRLRLAVHGFAGVYLSALAAGCATEPSDDGTNPGGLMDPYALVDPFIGTGGHGHTHPAASLPFGMIQAGPDTRLEGWDGCSGYHFDDDTIYGFSQTHLSGTGVIDYGDLLVMPFRWQAESDFGTTYPFAAGFDHAEESAEPGHYGVTLQNGLRVDVVAGVRTAVYRFVFPARGSANASSVGAGGSVEGAGGSVEEAGGSANGSGPGSENNSAGDPAIWIDLDHRDATSTTGIHVYGDSAVAAFRVSDAWAMGQHLYGWLQADRPFQNTKQYGNRLAIRFAPRTDGQPDTLELRMAISAVDTDGARNNLKADPDAINYRTLATAAEQTWREALNRVTVAGGSEDQRRVFYTAVYHALLAPNRFGDADGRYRAMDHQIHEATDFDPYTVLSLWDTYRAAHPFYTLAFPEQNAQVIRSMLDDFRRGGQLPIWKLADSYTGCMIGYHAVPVIVDAWFKGQRDWDDKLALEAMVHSAERPVLGLPAYRRYGYIPADAEGESVSKTLEYAYDDACIAAMAAAMANADAMGQRADNALPDGRSYIALADTFARRAGAWRHLYDPASGFFRARRNGGFVEPFDPAEVNFHFTEANAWQYSLAAAHDIPGHAQLANRAAGKADQEAPVRLATHVDALFDAPSQTSGRDQADITGLIGQYAHGNEPSHHVAYLYAHLGQPWKTQAKIREILNTQYGAKPDGLCGNEDCGQMSAWYVLSAAGMYPVTPGQPRYTLGSPLFDTVTWHFSSGKTLHVVARNQGPDRPFVRAVTWNGLPWDSVTVSHRQLAEGGTLVFDMAAEPAREWGVNDAAPAALVSTEHVLPAPFADPSPRVFDDSLLVTLRCADPRAKIEYREDNIGKWQVYTQPFYINKDQSFQYRSVLFVEDIGLMTSPVQHSAFRRRRNNYDLSLATPYAPQYAAGGDDALVDGLRGGSHWHTGDWQGYEGVNLDATLDLGAQTAIKSVTVGFLQDENAWIFYPTGLRVEGSTNLQEWTLLGESANPVPWSDKGVLTQDISVKSSGRYRYLRVTAVNRGLCPPEHKGAGHPGWIFADEIMVHTAP